jgi:hypothetical protein
MKTTQDVSEQFYLDAEKVMASNRVLQLKGIFKMQILGGIFGFVILMMFISSTFPAIGRATEAFFGFVIFGVIGYGLFRFFAFATNSTTSSSPLSTQQSKGSSPPPSYTAPIEEEPYISPKSNKSVVSSEYIQLEHDLSTNVLTGLVLKGAYATSKLEFLSLDTLMDLWREIAKDSQSLILLESYLDIVHPNWRQAARTSDQKRKEEQENAINAMSIEDAYDILGLKIGAGVDEIKSAYKKALDKNHPDHGGSNRLTILIYEAKKILLASEEI